MTKPALPWPKPTLSWLIISLLAVYQIGRLAIFANSYGGLEHDSGWFLGLARSLAETGRYATMVSTIADPASGQHENIYGQFNIQDEVGRVYFFTESGVYGAGILPNALLIKLFGAGFWQYRAGPLLFCLAMLLLASWLLYRFGRLLPVLIAHLFLFFYPQLLIFLGYEAMGEIFSLTYILLAFVLFIKATQAIGPRGRWFLGAGLAAGLAITTKPIALLSLGGLPLAWLLLGRHRQTSFKEGLLLAGGWLLVPLLWETTQLISLTLVFDFTSYRHHLAERFDFFFNEGGSGLGLKGSSEAGFLGHKLLMVKEISLANPLISGLVLLAIGLGGPLLIRRFYHDPLRRNILILLWGGWLAHSLWFVALSKNGWMRHDWYALMLAVWLLSIMTSWSWPGLKRPGADLFRSAMAFLFMGLLLSSFAGQPEAVGIFIPDRLVARWYREHLATNHTRIPWSLVPRQDQQAAVNFIAGLPPEAHIFYPEGHKSAEMAVLTGRILYPIERRPHMSPHPNDIVLIGPSLISPWRKPTEARITPADQQAFIQEVMKQVSRECPQIIFKNDYYLICGLKIN